MTRNQNGETPPGVRLMTDGGTDPTDRTVSKTVHADGVVTREVDGEDQELIRAPISSSRPDRENDEFAKEALEDMARQIREDQPLLFLNHGLAGNYMDAIPYDASETIGTHVDAEVEQGEDGEYDLFAYINPDGTHPEGERTLKQVRDEGQAVKFSVGFRVHNYDEKTDDAGNEIGAVFTNVDLMEDSKVGIPANPDASASAPVAAKDGTAGLPGVQNHPLTRMMEAMGGGAPGETRADDGMTVTKSGTTPERERETTPEAGKAFDEVDVDTFDAYVAAHQEGADAEDISAALDAISEWVGGLSRDATAELVAEATDSTTDEVDEMFAELMGDDGGDGDGDGEEEEGGDGEGDDDDDDDEEESSTTPDDGKGPVPREEYEELRSEVTELREAYEGDLGESKTADPTDDPRPDVDADADPDDGKDSEETEEPSEETKSDDGETDSSGPLFDI